MAEAKVVFVNIEPNKFKPEQTQMSVGLQVDGGETVWMRYTIAGGTEGQQKFASMQVSKMLKLGGSFPVTVQENDRGYTEVLVDDGFRPNSAPAPVADEPEGF